MEKVIKSRQKKVVIIKQSLQYLSESLSNYVEDDNVCQEICGKLENGNYEDEVDFVEALEEEEVAYLESVLQKEIAYASSAQDEIRVNKLQAIYQVLF